MRLPLAFVASLAASSVIAEEPAASDPDPFELTLAAAEFIAGLQSFSFRWFLSYDEVIDGREKLTYFQSGTNIMVRDGGFVVRTERDDTYRDYFFDGKTFTVTSPNENFYASTPFSGSFEDLVEAVKQRTDAVLPMWSIMSRSLPDRLIEGAEGAAYLGMTLIEGQLAHHVAFAGYDEDWQVWVSTDPDAPVPLMIVATDIGVQGWPQSRVRFVDWSYPIEAQPGQFTFVPDEDDVALAVARLDVSAGPAEAAQTDAEPASATERTGAGGKP